MIKAADLPPVWLIGFALLSLLAEQLAPIGQFSGPLFSYGAVLVAAASVLLGLWAVFALWRARTPLIPRREPKALVTTGPFRFTRNPIYLADLGLLVALGLWTGSVWPLVAAVPLWAVLERRFIRSEEAALDASFGADYRAWAARVRRWL